MPSYSRDIICIGASAGGVEALQDLVRSLPRDLNASLFVVLHMPPYAKSYLSEILATAGPLKTRTPINGERFQPGTIYVAPPDHHMLIEGDSVILVRGPKENRARPAVDPLFRSAAVHHPQRSIGIVLSGMLDDGKAGLWFLKNAGGLAVVQKLSDCLFPDMPRNASAETEIDHFVAAAEMGPLLQRLCLPTVDPPSSRELKTFVLAMRMPLPRSVPSRGTRWNPSALPRHWFVPNATRPCGGYAKGRSVFAATRGTHIPPARSSTATENSPKDRS